MRELIFSNNSTRSNISLESEGKITSDSKTVSKSFNNFFTNIAEELRTKIPYSRHHFSKWLTNPNANSFFISPTSLDEVLAIINTLGGKANEPNSIPVPILRVVRNEISLHLSNLVNLSFTTGVFPATLKEALVVPVFKSGSAMRIENYRPISLLSNIDKIYQKLMYKRLINFLNATKIIYAHQFGFRKKHSTTNALLKSIEMINETLDSGKFACAVFIDLQKAFDTVNHSILLSKMDHYGIRGVALSWFRSFLRQRKQFVSIANVCSELRLILHGVPQGSVLGPLLTVCK